MKHYKPSGGKTKKRLLALVLAAALVCSSLMPVYANDVALMDDDFSVMAMDEMPAAVTMDDSLDLAPGINESVDEFGNVVITWGSDTWTDWTQAGDDQLIASPYPDGEQMDPGFAIPTVTYRFWLSQKDKTELAAFNAEVESGVKLYGMTKAEYIDLYGPNDGMFSAIHVADGGSLWDNSFKNPTASDAPDAGKTVFAGWYTLDEYGYEQKFTFDADCKEDHVSNGIVYASEMATVDVFAKWSTAVIDQAEQPMTNPNYDDTLDDHTYDKWYAALVSSSDSAFQGLLEQYTADEGFCDWLDEMPEDEIKYLTERMDATAETIPSDTRVRTVGIEQGKTGSISITGMSTAATYTSPHSGITVKSNQGWGSYTGYTISVANTVPVGKYTLTVNYRTQTSSGRPSSTTVTDWTETVTVVVTEAKKLATVNSVVTNAEVFYCYYTGGTYDSTKGTWSGGTWEKSRVYKNGEEFSITYDRAEDPTHYVFFARPEENYLLSEFTIVNQSGGTSYDLYSVQDFLDFLKSETPDDESKDYDIAIRNYPDIEALIEKAGNDKYLSFNGYYTYAAQSLTLTQTFTGTQPGLKVTATANPNANVKPSDKVTFTINVEPQKVNAADKVTSLKITSLTINGKTYNDVELTPNKDGTYTATVQYEATAQDWVTGNIVLNVTADVGYEYVLPVQDRNGSTGKIKTTSTITNKGTTTVTLANPLGVAYTLVYDAPAGITPPNSIPSAPVDETDYYEGKPVPVKDYNRAPVVDGINGGTWEFTGWKKNGEGEDLDEDDSVTMGTEKILFVGTWTFTPNPNTTVTVAKNVTGLIGDTGKDFSFEVAFTNADGSSIDTTNITAIKTKKDGSEETLTNWSNGFTLKHNEYVTFSSVPLGTNITVTETNADGYDVSSSIANSPKYLAADRTADTKVEFTQSVTEKLTVTVTNKKTLIPDAGVDLGSATPYLFLLCVGAVGVATLRRKRRS